MIKGLEHFWFLTAIELCYIITPCLQIVKRNSGFSTIFLWCTIIFAYIVLPKYLSFMLSWIIAYSIGYLYAKLSISGRNLEVTLLLLLFCSLLSVISWDNILSYFDIKNRLMHDVLGCLVIFFLIRAFFSIIC